ncbi:MAG: DUF1552 domain-containing protein [Pirellulaceae bacterium]
MPLFNSTRPLSRRTMLRGAGACLALPLLEAMLPSTTRASSRFQPRPSSPAAHPRMICCYVPQGVNIYDWFPPDEGRDWTLTPTLQTLAPFKSELTLFSGLGHPNSTGGHEGDHTWLTGADLKGTPGKDYQNSVSIDQLAAERHGRETRFPSIELSEAGGAKTLAFDRFGTPLPAEQSPQRLFNRLFVPEGVASRRETLRRYAERSSILDVVAGQARNLHGRLGKTDQRKLDEYLGSVRETERRVERLQSWIDVPRPVVGDADLDLGAQWSDSHDHPRWLDVMLELAYLAFQTDATRVITFQWSREASALSPTARDHHALSHHGGDPDMLRGLAEIDRAYVARLARFLGHLQATEEADGTMLDSTMVLYGSGMNNGKGGGHSPQNLPLLLAGGRKLGLQQGRHLAYEVDSTPMSNLLLTMLHAMGVPRDSFMDSTGTLSGLT